MKKFRKDINGLRALAVISVFVYHFSPEWLTGGFSGVDVFFVISGFLMTGIILRGLEQESFSVIRFYMARANRIIPALAVLSITLLILGWFLLAPRDFRALGGHAASSMGFLSNFQYWLEAGYFDSASHEKWLLHTWSLSVEWQFYMLYPLGLVLIHRLAGLRAVKIALIATTILSFVYCVSTTVDRPVAAFYLLPSRLWELTLGGLAYLFPLRASRKYKVGMEFTGITLIVMSCILISDQNLWPGFLSLFPVLGAFLVIQSNREHSFATGNVAFQKIGLWSYSIYLWHWPIVVAFNYLGMGSYLHIFAGMTASILLGYLSYSLVENRTLFKTRPAGALQVLWSRPAVLMVAVGLLGTVVYMNEGYRFRQAEELQQLSDTMIMPSRHNGYCFYNFHSSGRINEVSAVEGTTCVLGDKSEKPAMLLIGDSFAGQYEPFWDQLYKNSGLALNSITTNWCYPSFTENFTGPKSNKSYNQCLLNREYFRREIGNYRTLVLAAEWAMVYKQGRIEEVFDVIDHATSIGINVLVMASPTSYDTDIAKRFMSSSFNGIFDLNIEKMPKENDVLTREANDTLRQYASGIDNVEFIERSALFSASDSFIKHGWAVPYSLDGMHISLIGSLQAATYFSQRDEYSKIREIMFD